MASFDTVLNAFRTARLDSADPLLDFLVQSSDWGDSDAQYISCLMVDGTIIRGSVGADMTMAAAIDAPVEKTVDERIASGAIPPDKLERVNEGRPHLYGRSVKHWLEKLLNIREEAKARTVNEDGTSLKWTEMSDEDLMLQTEFSSRHAITLVNATIERSGDKRAKAVPVLRVQFGSIASWWMGREQ
jgi:hypothetical protein